MNKFVLMIMLTVLISACAGKKDDVYKDMNAQQIYERGKQAAIKKNYSEAIKDFDALEARFPYGEYTDKGQLALISAYSNSDDSASAYATADRFIRVHPRHPNVDFAYYMKGVVNFNDNFSFAFRNFPIDRSKRDTKYAQQAFDDFKTLLDRFPNSKYAADARKRMIFIREQLANHELDIIKYYQSQGADLAVANRAGYLINQYPRTKAVQASLVMMRAAYVNLGMSKEALEVQQILDQNFPRHP